MSNVFQVPASKASIEQNQFKFSVPYVDSKGKEKSREFSLPLQQYINSSLRARVQRSGKALRESLDGDGNPTPEAIIEAGEIQQELLERYAPGLYDLVTDDQIRAIQEAWVEASNISMGESSPSAD